MGTLTEVQALLQDPAVAKRAAQWALKYGEDRTQPVSVRRARIVTNLMNEFKIDRKVAKHLTEYATREWA